MVFSALCSSVSHDVCHLGQPLFYRTFKPWRRASAFSRAAVVLEVLSYEVSFTLLFQSGRSHWAWSLITSHLLGRNTARVCASTGVDAMLVNHSPLSLLWSQPDCKYSQLRKPSSLPLHSDLNNPAEYILYQEKDCIDILQTNNLTVSSVAPLKHCQCLFGRAFKFLIME